MSRRRSAEDTARALNIRRVQEQAALLALQTQQRKARDARDELGIAREAYENSEALWEDALRRPAFDPGAMALWQAGTEAALRHVRRTEQIVTEEDQTVSDSRRAWDRHLRLAEAVNTVARNAARALARADDERRLLASEDAARSRRAIR